MQWPKEKGKK